jgi:hypothetical protein
LVRGLLADPGKETAVFDKRLPARNVPVHVFCRRHSGARLAAEEYNDGIGLGRNKSEDEDILGAYSQVSRTLGFNKAFTDIPQL